MTDKMISRVREMREHPDVDYRVRNFHHKTLRALESRRLVRRLLNGRVILTAAGKRYRP